MPKPTPTPEMVLLYLKHPIKCAKAFVRQDVMLRLLELIVTRTVSGNPPTQGEILRQMWPGKATENVRVNAERLRDLLEIHYGADGHNDHIKIDVPKGHYAAIYEFNPAILASSDTFASALDYHYGVPADLSMSWFDHGLTPDNDRTIRTLLTHLRSRPHLLHYRQ